ncbi:MAG: hypothetical protein EBV03_09535 [Proteobacteria bacterium]|nr:hypothetical protein [Pseudomonadota bacterium]
MDLETATQTAKGPTPEMVGALMDLTTNSIYLMGASFVLGSLFTLFLLLVLDFIRSGKGENGQ